MALGPASAGGVGAQRPSAPSAPTHRPTWLLILSSITLFYGGLTLVSGLSKLRNPAAVTRFPTTRPLGPEEDAEVQELTAITADVQSRHAGALRGQALAGVVVALLMLYAAAAALARDKLGRRANLIAAWVGIVYQIGTLPLVIPVYRDWANASSPIVNRVFASRMGSPPAADAGAGAHPAPATGVTLGGPGAATDAGTKANDPGDPPMTPETLAQLTRTVYVGAPILSAIVGILGSLLIIGYFGGRRGRALYGLPPRG